MHLKKEKEKKKKTLLNLLQSTPQTNLIGLHGDDGTQSEDEGVDIFHVQVICGHGI